MQARKAGEKKEESILIDELCDDRLFDWALRAQQKPAASKATDLSQGLTKREKIPASPTLKKEKAFFYKRAQGEFSASGKSPFVHHFAEYTRPWYLA